MQWDTNKLSFSFFWVFLGITLFLFLIAIIFHYFKFQYFFYAFFNRKKAQNIFPKAEKQHYFTYLIPARDESKVIENLLKSIKNQTYDSNKINVVIGVENLNDPTVKIAKEYNFNIYLRQNFEIKGKGQLVNEMINFVNQNNLLTDAFIIMDADNLLDANFTDAMNNAYNQGYDVAVGYRNNKNWNSSWVSACSGLTFSRFSHLENLKRTKNGTTIQLSGTGFYISKKQIEKFGGWNFFTLTEDLELTINMALDNTKCAYVSDAIFYDEQPIKLNDANKQRLRWIKGHNQLFRKYRKSLNEALFKKSQSNKVGCFELKFQAVSFASFILSIIFIIATISLGIWTFYISHLNQKILITIISNLIAILLGLIIYYFSIVIYTALSIYADPRVAMTTKMKWKACFMQPIYLFWYIPLFIKALCKKEVQWTKIDHSINIDLNDLQNK
ncbi:glycosyltransferase family 2 protein [Mycoplasmopsis gallinarum]|uniref:N-acetylglucosaminyltransferase n=1 Tax=Mycoplasmopsis gallinarum TaxID=29557 RepID=A0A168RF33_9BACT|nr:glycosyltransferase family 2 protein [Mycoplasmopsis gallinarum]OAB48918.1 N-acetylglucosaminyltransferase [Mycoplasmopsis gallinarum]